MVTLQQEEHYQLSYMDVLKFNLVKRYATFSGRASRSEFWRFILVISIINSINAVIELLVNVLCGETSIASDVVSGIVLIINLVFVLPQIAITCRRLHDIGKSGWNQLLICIPVVGPLILLAFTVSAGNSGVNVYGPEPQGIVITPAMAKQIDKEATPTRREDYVLVGIYATFCIVYWIYIMAFAIGGAILGVGL